MEVRIRKIRVRSVMTWTINLVRIIMIQRRLVTSKVKLLFKKNVINDVCKQQFNYSDHYSQ